MLVVHQHIDDDVIDEKALEESLDDGRYYVKMVNLTTIRTTRSEEEEEAVESSGIPLHNNKISIAPSSMNIH